MPPLIHCLCRPQKVVETIILDMGCAPLVRMPTRAICGAWLALRAEAASLQDLKRRLNELNRNRTAGAAVGGVATPSELTPVSAMGTVSYTPGSGELDDGNRTKRIKIKVHYNHDNGCVMTCCADEVLRYYRRE